MTPLLLMMLFCGLAHQQFANEGVTILSAFGGLCVGALLVRWRSHATRFDARLQPVLVDEHQAVRFHS